MGLMGNPDPVSVSGFRLFHFDVLLSTQIEAKKPEYRHGDVVIAASQTGGYGRRGRAWMESAGNLYFTMVQDFIGATQLGYLPYVIGLALYDAVAEHLSDPLLLRLKWPNDVLIEGQKISGILIEVSDDKLLIGIGVNVAMRPETDQPVACIDEYAASAMGVETLLHDFLHHYALWLARAEQGGFAAIKADWLARAFMQGQEITARLANGTVLTGIFKDLDAHGALVLQGETAHHVITSADIFFSHSNQ